MTETLDDYSRAFTEYAGTIPDECLDIGCAYGVATLPALANGARVLASDLESKHLEILARRVPPADRPRFRSQQGKLPGRGFSGGQLRCDPLCPGAALPAAARTSNSRSARCSTGWCPEGGCS